MNNLKNKLTIFMAIALTAAGMQAKSAKRGVSENQFTFASQMEILEPGVSWYYNWGNAPGTGYQNEVSSFEGFEYIPMCWSAAYDADKIRNYCKTHPQTKYLLGFNEPNFTKQANMTPEQAAENWPAVQALANELGLKIVAPAMNYSPNPPYQDPVKWFDEFVQLVGKDAFDYVAIHNYGGLGVMKTLAGTFHEKYGKDVWVTEFCYWPNEGQANSRVEPAVQIASMMECVEWLEKTPWIYRYAWFKPVGKVVNTATDSSPCFGLIVPMNGLGDRELSEQGFVYTYMTTFDETVFHPVGKKVPASEYISQSNILLGKGANPDCTSPIEITQFNAGASADYQFDITASGNYLLTLTVSGQGEPIRFDPQIGIFAVDADGTDETAIAAPEKITLSGDNAVYTTYSFNLNLPAGKQTIRIKDTNPYQPSGIRISTLQISDPAGIEGVEADSYNGDVRVDVYNLTGIKLRENVSPTEAADGLPAGIYIIGNKKVVIR